MDRKDSRGRWWPQETAGSGGNVPKHLVRRPILGRAVVEEQQQRWGALPEPPPLEAQAYGQTEWKPGLWPGEGRGSRR